MGDPWGRKWSYIEDLSKKERRLFWIVVPTALLIIFFILLGILYLSRNLDHSVLFLIVIGILIFIGLLGLAIRIGGTYNASKLKKEGAEKQKKFAIALVISLFIMPIWLVPILLFMFTTQTDYSDVDPILIEKGIIEDKSHLYYLPTMQVVSILVIAVILQMVLIYYVIRFFQT